MNYDRVSIDPKSPYFLPPKKTMRIGVKLNGVIRGADVQEFCVSEGWVSIQLRKGGRVRQERGKVLTIKLRGEVKLFDRYAET